MEQLEIFRVLQEKFGGEKVLQFVQTGDEKKGFKDSFIEVPPQSLLEICQYLRTDPNCAFDMLHCVSGVDCQDHFESVYHLFSMRRRHWVVLKVRVPKSDPRVPSVAHIWPAADWHERESYDLVGILYDNHPNLKRILLPEEWEGHPLQKDYVMPDHDRLRELGL